MSIKDKIIGLLLTIMLLSSINNTENYKNEFPVGYNKNTDCNNINEEDDCEMNQCNGIKTFDNQIGPQGINNDDNIIGYSRDIFANF